MADYTDKQLRNCLIYQIFVRNYSEEGTFAAVERDLDRIKALGTDIIYFLPIHPIGEACRKGSLGSPYAIRDYRAVNPEYGTLEDFRQLTDAIHARGMKCMMDVVYNHTSPDSVLAAEHPEWFYHKPDGSFGNRVGDWTDIIDLDYANPDLWDYQIETLKYWARFADGFRCDVAPLVPGKFWERARAEVETVRPGCIWLAESVEKEFILELRSRGLIAQSDGEIFKNFDISYDYDIYGEMKAYLQGDQTLADYLEAINRQEWIYPENYVKLRFLENHDQTRAGFLIPEAKSLRNFLAFSFFQKGTAFVYAGQEFRALHLPSLFDRDTIFCNAGEGEDLSPLISRLAQIKKNPVFTQSTYQVKAGGKDICVAEHKAAGQQAVGIFSFRGDAACVKVPLADGIYRNEIDGSTVEIFHGSLCCEGEPMILIP